MINQAAENLNKEQGAQGGAERIQPKFETQVSKLKDKEKKEQQITKEEIANIEKEFDTTEEIKKETKPTPETIDKKDIDKKIQQLNRPEATKGIKESYTTIQQEIENSDQDKNIIARGLGKLIKRINP